MPQSPNKTVISSLVETLQRKVEPAKLYSALLAMNTDLNKAYNALFFGPLPAVNANALTNLNALNIDGIIPEENMPANIAFQDRENLFDDINEFVNENESSIAIGFGTLDADREYVDEPTSWFRFGSIANGEFYLSQNYSYDGSDFSRDNESISGSIIKFDEGNIIFNWLAPADGISYPDPHLEETFTIEGKMINCANYEQDNDFLNLLIIDEFDIIRFADEAGSYTDLFRGHMAIPNKADTKLPAGAAECDGILVINKTPATATLCYYSKGTRYKLTGVVF